MAPAMTEHTFIRSLHTRLKNHHPNVYTWKINDQYQGGVADAYYSDKSDMWVEYKYLPSLPKRPKTLIRVDLSALQQDWLRARHAQGRNVAVVVGSPVGSIILPGISWDKDITAADFNSSMVDKKAVVSYILDQVTRLTQEGRNDQTNYHSAGP